VEYHSTQARRRRNQPPSWLWFFAGLLVGALAVGLMWMKQDAAPLVTKQKSTESKPASKPIAKQGKKTPEPDKKEEPKTNFEFYTVLPEMEVMVPEKEISKPPVPVSKPTTPAAAPETANPISKAGEPVYLLQMGSFRNFKDADRLKARLGLLGIEADIQTVTIDSKTGGKATTHRVRSGPYTRNQAHDMHGMLKNEKIDSMAIKIKK